MFLAQIFYVQLIILIEFINKMCKRLIFIHLKKFFPDKYFLKQIKTWFETES